MWEFCGRSEFGVEFYGEVGVNNVLWQKEAYIKLPRLERLS